MSSEHADEDYQYSKAVIVASLLAIVILAALVFTTHTRRQPFTQLWLKSWKVNLSNETGSNRWTGLPDPNFTGVVLGHKFFVFKTPSRGLYGVAFQSDLTRGVKIFFHEGDTIYLGQNALFLDSVDIQGHHALFWEYPRRLKMAPRRQLIRFSFVIRNRLGREHNYTIKVATSKDNSTEVERVRLMLPISAGEEKECTVSFPLSRDDVISVISGAAELKVSTRLDTGQEVRFWLGRRIRG